MPLADAAMARKDDAAARRLLEAIVERRASPAMDRTARVKLYALSANETVRSAVVRSFSADSEAVAVYALTSAALQNPQDPYLSYLLGRKLFAREASADALEQLTVAIKGPLPESIRNEAFRLAIEAAFGAGDCRAVALLKEQATDLSRSLAARAADWVERCTFMAPE
jgi:hypothetical protein